MMKPMSPSNLAKTQLSVIAAVIACCAFASLGASPATTYAAQALPALDLARWTQWNIEVVADAAKDAGKGGDQWEACKTALEFTLQLSSAIADDDGLVSKVVAIGVRAAATTRPQTGCTWWQVFAKMPRDERLLRQWLRAWPNDAGQFPPLVEVSNSYNVATSLQNIPEPDYERLAGPIIEQLDRLCRAASKWNGLELFYETVAADALDRGQPRRANRYIDRLLCCRFIQTFRSAAETPAA